MQVLHHYAEALDASVAVDVSAIGAPPFLRRRRYSKHSHRFEPSVRPTAVCAGGALERGGVPKRSTRRPSSRNKPFVTLLMHIEMQPACYTLHVCTLRDRY